MTRYILLLLLCLTVTIRADEKKQKKKAPSHLMVGGGAFDVDKSRPCAMFQAEYRAEVHCHHIRPLAGIFGTVQGSLFVYGGMGWDIFIGKYFVITPSFAPGVYYHGNGKHLGFPINFRSSIETSVVLPNQGRIGAMFYHISNASMLFHNPGVDCLVAFYSIPL